jgi:hypothetical protein
VLPLPLLDAKAQLVGLVVVVAGVVNNDADSRRRFGEVNLLYVCTWYDRLCHNAPRPAPATVRSRAARIAVRKCR